MPGGFTYTNSQVLLALHAMQTCLADFSTWKKLQLQSFHHFEPSSEFFQG